MVGRASVLVAALFLAACATRPPAPSEVDTAPEPELPAALHIAAVYNRSGPQAALDVPSLRGAQLAVEHANATGALGATPIELTVVDAGGSPDQATQQLEAAFSRNQRIAAVVGLSDTDYVRPVAPVAANRGVAFVTSGATAPSLPNEVPDHLFLACFGDNVQAAAAAEWARRDLGVGSAIVLFDESATYTRLLHRYFETSFRQLGGRITASFAYSAGSVLRLPAAVRNAELVYVAAGSASQAASVVRALRQADYNGPVLGGDSLDAPTVWASERGLKRVYFTTHAYLGQDNPAAPVVSFRRAYRRTYGNFEPDAFAALGYDATRLVIEAASRTRSIAPQAIQSELSRTTDFQGVTGTITYEPGTRIPTKSVTIMGVESGRVGFVRQLEPSQVPDP